MGRTWIAVSFFISKNVVEQHFSETAFVAVPYTSLNQECDDEICKRIHVFLTGFARLAFASVPPAIVIEAQAATITHPMRSDSAGSEKCDSEVATFIGR